MSEILDLFFSYKSIMGAFSGAAGGIAAYTCFYPLEVLKVR